MDAIASSAMRIASLQSSAEAVSSVLTGLARRIGHERYEVWFRNSTRVRMDAGAVEVQVPNAFIHRLLSEQCTSPLRAAAEEVLGQPAEVRFVVRTDAFAPDAPARKAEKQERPDGPKPARAAAPARTPKATR